MSNVRVDSTKLLKTLFTYHSNRTVVFSLYRCRSLATCKQRDLSEMGAHTKLAYETLFFTFILNIAFTLTFRNQIKVIGLIALGDLYLLWWTNLQLDFTDYVVFHILVAAEDHASFKCKSEDELLDFLSQSRADSGKEGVNFSLLFLGYVDVVQVRNDSVLDVPR